MSGGDRVVGPPSAKSGDGFFISLINITLRLIISLVLMVSTVTITELVQGRMEEMPTPMA
jgi:hypothetical protein